MLETLFAEEAGIIIEVEGRWVKNIKNIFHAADVLVKDIGFVADGTGRDAKVKNNICKSWCKSFMC